MLEDIYLVGELGYWIKLLGYVVWKNGVWDLWVYLVFVFLDFLFGVVDGVMNVVVLESFLLG